MIGRTRSATVVHAVLGAALLGLSACGSPMGSETDGDASPDAARPDSVASEDTQDGGVSVDGDPDAVADALDAADAVHEADASPDVIVTPGMLDTTVVAQIVEPEGSGKDDGGASFTDKNYWNFCMPGAATVALYHFLPKNVTAWPAASFKEPKNQPSTIPAAGTYWESDEKVNGYHTYGRSYLMYLAEEVKPPSYGTAGMANFSTYPSTGANMTDLRDALNWEASGHAKDYATFFYSIVSASGLTQATLHADVTKTIDGGHAVVVAADTGLLPNWSRSLSHAITVVGYDDKASTYKYTDTCGVRCNGSSKSKNGGVWTISQVGLYNAIKADGGGYVK
jgi:hypothetical protein